MSSNRLLIKNIKTNTNTYKLQKYRVVYNIFYFNNYYNTCILYYTYVWLLYCVICVIHYFSYMKLTINFNFIHIIEHACINVYKFKLDKIIKYNFN